MSAAALYSLDSPACYKSWCLEPANFYDAKVGSGGGTGPGCKPGSRGGCGGMSGEEAGGGLGGSGTNLAELSAAAPAMYEDESAIDFSSYIDSMSAVPNLELCNDELFADLFNSNHKPERGGDYGEYLPPGGGAGRDPAKDLGAAMTTLLGAEPRTASSSSSPSSFSSSSSSSRGALKQEPDWSDSDLSSSLLTSQIATCAQTIMNLSGQPTPPTSPEPPGSSSPSSCSTRSPGPAAAAGTAGAAAVPGSAQGVPAPPAAGGKERGGKKCVDRFSPEYRQRRERNNIAVRKSRDKAKRRNQEMQQKLLELSAENEKLHKKIEQLTRDLTSLRHFFKQLPSASFLQPGSGTDCR